MVLDASCQISYRSNAPIPAIMMLRPRSGYAQWVTREEYAFEPPYRYKKAVLWPIRRAIRLLQQKGRSISDELLVHLSPLGGEHIGSCDLATCQAAYYSHQLRRFHRLRQMILKT
jgi:hypothetical protein